MGYGLSEFRMFHLIIAGQSNFGASSLNPNPWWHVSLRKNTFVVRETKLFLDLEKFNESSESH